MNAGAIASRIRAILASRSAAPPDDAAEIARAWAALVGEAQHRLDRTAAWIERGLRSEAIELATAAPSVYETARLAWDPSLSGWDDFCSRHRLPRAPILLHPSIDRLSECQLQLQPLAPALARWRKLNIGRAPATERLDQMRQLRRLDPENPIWMDDAPSLERAALAEAIDASERALAVWEIERVWGVIRWIEGGEWVAAPARQAAEALRERVRELSGRSALERARQVVDRLHAEYMAESVDSAGERLREWEALRAFLAESGVEPPRELDESVQPVVEWLRERQEASQRLIEHRTNARELAALVEAPAVGHAALASLLDRVSRGPEPAAAELIAAARRRLRSLERARTARRIAVAVAGLAVAAILFAVAFVLVDRQARRAAADRFLERIDRAISLGDLDGLDGLVDRGIAEDPALGDGGAPAEARRRIAQARAQRLRDDAAFDAGLESAGDPARPDAREDSVDPLDALARTAEQRARLDSWRDARRLAESSRQQARDAAFIAALAEVEAGLGRAASLGDGEMSLELSSLRSKLEELAASPGVSAPALARARPILVRVDALDAALQQRRALDVARASESAEIDAMMPLLRDAPSLAAALRRFAERHPESVHAEAFLDAAMDEPAWRSVQAWIEARRPLGKPLSRLDDAERAEARRALRDFLSAHPRSVHAAAADAALAHLEPANDWKRWLAGVLDSSPLLALDMVALRDGRRFYYEQSQAPQPTSDGFRVYRVVKRLRDPATASFDSEFMRLDPKQIVSDGESPQRVLARVLRASLRDGSLQGVEGLLASMDRVRDATGVDAVLRAGLLAGLLDRLAAAAPALAPDLREATTRLDELETDRIEWLDPASTEARERSREIDAALPRLIETKRWLARWRGSEEAADAAVPASFECVGLLLADGPRRELRSSASPPAGELVVLRSSGSAPDRASAVGRVTVGADGSVHVDFDEAAVEAVPSGTPLFQRRGPAPLPKGAS